MSKRILTENFKHFFEIISKFYETIIEFQETLKKDHGLSSLNKKNDFASEE